VTNPAKSVTKRPKSSFLVVAANAMSDANATALCVGCTQWQTPTR
jgi:hypothetical protein